MYRKIFAFPIAFIQISVSKVTEVVTFFVICTAPKYALGKEFPVCHHAERKDRQCSYGQPDTLTGIRLAFYGGDLTLIAYRRSANGLWTICHQVADGCTAFHRPLWLYSYANQNDLYQIIDFCGIWENWKTPQMPYSSNCWSVL